MGTFKSEDPATVVKLGEHKNCGENRSHKIGRHPYRPKVFWGSCSEVENQI